jgi:hypothetical protein
MYAFGHAVIILLDGKQTGEKFTAFLNVTPAGGGPGPHYQPKILKPEAHVAPLSTPLRMPPK